MEILYSYSDIGSVLVGDKKFRAALPNLGGDGITKLIVGTKEEVAEFTQDANFVTSIEGEFNVFNYDCSKGDTKDIIGTFNGRYGVFSADRMVILEKWGE